MEKWKEHIRTGHLQCHEVWYALTAMIMKTMEYPLLTLMLTEKECNYIMVLILLSGLPACSVCHHFPHDIIYAPKFFWVWGYQIST